MKLSKVKVGLILAIVGVFTVATLLTAFLLIPKTPVDAFDSESDVTSNAVVVGDIWNSSAKAFNATNFNKLLSYISSNGTISGVNTNEQTAADIRGYTYGDKDPNKSVVVTIGNYKWQVVYLTRTGNTTGDRIATLLMVNNDGIATYGNSSSYYGPNDFINGYPTGMYGTSHIRAVTLNNGGYYINIYKNSDNPNSATTASKSSSHKYALYTVESNGLTNYLVQPQEVWYQTEAQLTGSNNPTNYTLNNESLSTTINTGWYGSSYTYQGKNYYTEWGDDYLWLPSISEAGTADSELGIWELSTTERSASSSWWSRSGSYPDSTAVYRLGSSGSGYGAYYVDSSNGVRPALHLNLDAIAATLTKDIIVTVSDSQQGIVSGGGTYAFDYAGNSTITAIGINGYLFDYWQDSVGNKIYENSYTFPVTKTETYTAYFRLPQITFTSGNSGAEIAKNTVATDNIYRRHQLDFTTGNYISSVSINGSPPQEIDCLSGTLIADSACLGITYLTNASASRIVFEFAGVVDDITVTLYFTNIIQALEPPSASGGASGIVVSATLGGVASVVGDDFESLNDTDTIIFIAKLAQNGYRFSHWEDAEGNNLGTQETLTLTKAEAYNKKITAVFVPIDQSNANSSLDNDQTQEFN